MQKYKVFINDKWIFFGDFESRSELEPFQSLEYNEPLILHLVQMIKSEQFKENIAFEHLPDVEKSFQFFVQKFKMMDAAGGVVQNKDEAILMIKRFGLWDFPKGKVEENEEMQAAARREVEEETAVENLEIRNPLPTAYHIYRYGSDWIVKRTFWFLMRSYFQGKLIPQKEEAILDAKWVSKKDFPEYMQTSYASLREMIQEAGLLT
jgi:8-oxo-dGTP pyrophosphatase MutT (NUDIX family)